MPEQSRISIQAGPAGMPSRLVRKGNSCRSCVDLLLGLARWLRRSIRCCLVIIWYCSSFRMMRASCPMSSSARSRSLMPGKWQQCRAHAHVVPGHGQQSCGFGEVVTVAKVAPNTKLISQPVHCRDLEVDPQDSAVGLRKRSEKGQGQAEGKGERVALLPMQKEWSDEVSVSCDSGGRLCFPWALKAPMREPVSRRIGVYISLAVSFSFPSSSEKTPLP